MRPSVEIHVGEGAAPQCRGSPATDRGEGRGLQVVSGEAQDAVFEVEALHGAHRDNGESREHRYKRFQPMGNPCNYCVDERSTPRLGKLAVIVRDVPIGEADAP